jgi:diguanylate cyclase (GGDEF)-like protein/PAS domain S-box-containing protein
MSDPRRASLASSELAGANPSARVTHVESEAAFSEALLGGDFEIVLTDRQLDWADGITVLRAVKRRFPDCPVLMLTSAADLDLGRAGTQWGLYGAFQSSSSKLSGLSDVVAHARQEADLRRASLEAGAGQSHLGDLVPTGLFRFAADGGLLRANAAFAELLGHSDLDPLLATTLDRLFAKREQTERWRQLLDRHGAVAAFETELVRRDGGVLRVEMAARAVRDATDHIAYYEASARDITSSTDLGLQDAREATRVLEAQDRIIRAVCAVTGDEFFRSLVRTLAEAFGVRYAFVSEAVDPEARRVRLVSVYRDSEHDEGVEYNVEDTPCATVVGRARAYYPIRLRDLFPKSRWHHEHRIESYFAEPVFDRSMNPLGHFGVMHDRSLRVHPAFDPTIRLLAARASAELERRREERHSSYLAHHDPVTDLPNRPLFLDRLNQSLSRASWRNVLVAVLLSETDRLDVVAAMGQHALDRVVRAIASRLRSCVRDGDTVARLGPGQFGLVLVDVASAVDVAPIARKILDSLATPFDLEGHESVVSTSIGISLYPADAEDPETLVRCAEAALHNARRRSRNSYSFFTGALNQRAAEKLKLEARLRRALERNEFVVHYQPQMDLASGRVTGVEALIRWRSPEAGLIGPNDFIPVLEETGLIVPVGEWVLREACTQNKRWKEAGLSVPRIAVNLSGRQLNDPSLVSTVGRVLKDTGLDPASLELEITEGMIENADEAVKILHGLSSMGVRLAIDDFGTGYSSLSYLKSFPINTLKIDQTFVRDVTTDADDAAIAKAIIAMAHSLKLNVIAEGVETREQLDFLSSEACDEIQGFLFGRPLPALDLPLSLDRMS